MKEIQMVDLAGQYRRIQKEVDRSIREVIESTAFINGPEVKHFSKELEDYLGCRHVISCGNGTDALQVSLMALGFVPGDEVITTGFTFVAALEVISLLGLKPVLVDVDPKTFNISPAEVEKAITARTRALIPVHLFGQCCHMEPLLELAEKYRFHIIEDAAQALGSRYIFSDQTSGKAGTIGDVGCISFFPSKNLGCYGDGGALITDNDTLADSLRSIVNHGAHTKYYHQRVGVNSRLDSLQAAILRVKLKYLDTYNAARIEAAAYYNEAFRDIPGLEIPYTAPYSTHTYHQYTLQVKSGNRAGLMDHLTSKGIPSMVYYPVPLHLQQAYSGLGYAPGTLPVSEYLCDHVLSIPMHTELEKDQLQHITQTIISYVRN